MGGTHGSAMDGKGKRKCATNLGTLETLYFGRLRRFREEETNG